MVQINQVMSGFQPAFCALLDLGAQHFQLIPLYPALIGLGQFRKQLPPHALEIGKIEMQPGFVFLFQ